MIRSNRKQIRNRASNGIASAKDFFLKVKWYKDEIKNSFNKIRLTLNQLSMKILKLLLNF